jgi:ubiquinone/menaquinone biosynthesis C-methylase UbiE
VANSDAIAKPRDAKPWGEVYQQAKKRICGLIETIGMYTKLLTSRRRNRADLSYALLEKNELLLDGSSFLNLGYWKDTEDYGDACRAMVDLVADAAGIAEGHYVVDAGCGFGDQDYRIATLRHPASIVALNITDKQLAYARERFAHPAIEFRKCSATSITVPDGCIDAVVSIEAAFHFDTRESFLQEAYRVLRPGARLSVADIVPLQRDGRLLKGGLNQIIARQVYQVPSANLYGVEEYERILVASGFRDVAISSIRDRVFPGFSGYMARLRQDSAEADRLHPLVRYFGNLLLGDPFAISDYLLVTARKPLQA